VSKRRMGETNRQRLNKGRNKQEEKKKTTKKKNVGRKSESQRR